MNETVVWRGQDPEFTPTIATELGILLDPERAVIAIRRAGPSSVVYTVEDGSTELSILTGGVHLEVSVTIGGQTVSRRMEITGLPAQRVHNQCAALANRVQARWCAEMVVDEPQR